MESTRVKTRPPYIPQWVWDASWCSPSPTTAHHFILRTYKAELGSRMHANGNCVYCNAEYRALYGGRKRKKESALDYATNSE